MIKNHMQLFGTNQVLVFISLQVQEIGSCSVIPLKEGFEEIKLIQRSNSSSDDQKLRF